MDISADGERAPILEVSATQEIVIPASILAQLGIQPGQRFMVLSYEGIIHLTPLISLEEAFGSMPGLDTIIDREDDEERI